MKISQARSLRGKPALPADKSISHRAALIASIASGRTQISNFSASADCASTLSCLRNLGVVIEQEDSRVTVTGKGLRGFVESPRPLDCGNSGTTMRLLAGILAGQDIETSLIGDSSLMSRPMERIAEPLALMGAAVTTSAGRAPLDIRGKSPLLPIEYSPPHASAQIKSAVLLAGLFADGETRLVEPNPTRDHTERMLRWFGVDVGRTIKPSGIEISIRGGQEPSARFISVPSDISASAFFMVAAASLPGSEIEFTDLGINPTRDAVIRVLRNLGVALEIFDAEEVCNEPVAKVRIRGGIADNATGKPAKINGPLIPNLIDELPVLAVLGTKLPCGLEVRDAAELRNKESDRISMVVQGLTSMGADVKEFADGFYIGRSNLTGARIETHGDHRIAMAFAIAGLLAEGETEIIGAECAEISFPRFFETLHSVVR